MGLDRNYRICGLLFADDVVLLAPTTRKLGKALKSVERWAKIFEMKFGAQKCGVMGVGDGAHERVLDQHELWRLNDESLPIVTEYLYLGVLLNRDLDLDVVAKDRASKGSRALNAIRPVLTSSSIPSIIKTRLVNAVLVPTLSYGGEIWGMQQPRCRWGQAVLSQALRLMAGIGVKSSRTSSDTLSLEFDIHPLAVTTAAARTRALWKFPCLRTYIADLARAPMVSRKRTWVSGTLSWLSRYYNDVFDKTSPASASRFVKSNMLKKCMDKATGVTVTRYLECDFKSSAKYQSYAYKYHAFCKGIWWLTRLRVNAFWTAKAFHRILWLPDLYRNRCPFCNEVGEGETIEHFLVSCSAWAGDRRECLGELLDEGATFFNLLGGSKYNGGWTSDQVRTHWVEPREENAEDDANSQASNESHRDVERRPPGFVQVAMYLQQVMPRRLRRLAVLLKTPRADAVDNGMAALTEGQSPDPSPSDEDDDDCSSVGTRLGPEIHTTLS